MRWTAQNIPDQKDRVAIVTGANSGIGYETARHLAAKGAHVVLACRSETRGVDARDRILSVHPQASVEFQHLDLASLSSVVGFAGRVLESQQRLDLLINNAGIMIPPLSRTCEGFEMQFGVNHLGHFALTARLFPLLDTTRSARVVTVSSMTHRRGVLDFENLSAEKGYRAWPAYAQSKLANLLFTYELQRRLEARGGHVQALAAHPGWTATSLLANSLPIRLLSPIFAMHPEDGAMPTLRAATDLDAKGGDYYGPSHLFEMRGAPRKVRSNRRSQDREVAARLWTVSERLTGVPFEVAEDQADVSPDSNLSAKNATGIVVRSYS
ncbi:MAG: oxidoreductase [Acidobacteriota bacterium]